MARLHKFLAFSSQERRLLIRAFLLVAAVRLGLWTLPFATLVRILAWWARPASVHEALPPGRMAWAVTTVSRYVPQATCLTQALSAHLLLIRAGAPASLRIGVNKDVQGRFQAHAWLVNDGEVIIGVGEHENYVPLDLGAAAMVMRNCILD